MRMLYAIFTLLILLSGGVSLSQEQIKLSDEADRMNYAIGHQIGTDFKKQKAQLDDQALQLGMNDGQVGNKPLLDAREMNQRLVDLKRNITKDMEAEALERLREKQDKAREKQREGREFLEANRTKEEVVTTASGLQYKVITSGSGPMPKANDRVRINYRARRLDGREFDSSYKKGGSSVYRVDVVVPGFSEALRLMKPGARWELYIPEQLAFRRRHPLEYETVIVEVELLEILGPDLEGQAEKVAPATE